MGYILPITPCERRILRTVLYHQQSICYLCAVCGRVVYSVHRANKRSIRIGDRRILKNKIKIGYFLNEEI